MLFEVKFLHLLPETSGQIGTAIFPESSVEPKVFFLSNLQMIIPKQLLKLKQLLIINELVFSKYNIADFKNTNSLIFNYISLSLFFRYQNRLKS